MFFVFFSVKIPPPRKKGRKKSDIDNSKCFSLALKSGVSCYHYYLWLFVVRWKVELEPLLRSEGFRGGWRHCVASLDVREIYVRPGFWKATIIFAWQTVGTWPKPLELTCDGAHLSREHKGTWYYYRAPWRVKSLSGHLVGIMANWLWWICFILKMGKEMAPAFIVLFCFRCFKVSVWMAVFSLHTGIWIPRFVWFFFISNMIRDKARYWNVAKMNCG